MKNNILFLVAMLLLLFSHTSCSNGEDSHPGYEYTLKIRVEDKCGNDKVKDIGYIENESSNIQLYEVKKNLYRSSVTETGKKDEKLTLHPLMVHKTIHYEYLILKTQTLPQRNYRPSQLEHQLVCDYIFGDKQTHTITSLWEENTSTQNVCISIVVDGVTYRAEEMDNEGVPIFAIVLAD